MAPQHNPFEKGKKMKKVDRPKTDGRSAPRGFRRLRRNEYLKEGDVYLEDTTGKWTETEFLGHPADWALDVTPDLFYYRRIGAKRPGARRAKGSLTLATKTRRKKK